MWLYIFCGFALSDPANTGLKVSTNRAKTETSLAKLDLPLYFVDLCDLWGSVRDMGRVEKACPFVATCPISSKIRTGRHRRER